MIDVIPEEENDDELICANCGVSSLDEIVEYDFEQEKPLCQQCWDEQQK